MKIRLGFLRLSIIGLCIVLSACLEESESEQAGLTGSTPATDDSGDSGSGADGSGSGGTDTNSAPTISGSPPASIAAGQAYSFRPSSSDADGDTLTFSIENQPGWAGFNPGTGRLTGTPGQNDVGNYDGIVIAVTDGVASDELEPFSITVVEPPSANSAPTISGDPPSQVTAGDSYDFTPTADDADGDVLTFNVSNAPGWAAFDADTGNLSGTPSNDDAGTYSGIVIAVTDGSAVVELPEFQITVEASNRAPQISGDPGTQAVQDQHYTFTPTAEDADGDTLTFSIENLPGWAEFDTATGRLDGTPTAADVGTYASIVISVSDGEASDSLPAFSIAVDAIANGSATLSWMPPTENTDGSALTDLAGYSVHWGQSPGAYSNSVDLDAGLTSYVVENLSQGTWYFATRAYNADGVYSDYSNEASKTIE